MNKKVASAAPQELFLGSARVDLSGLLCVLIVRLKNLEKNAIKPPKKVVLSWIMVAI